MSFETFFISLFSFSIFYIVWLYNFFLTICENFNETTMKEYTMGTISLLKISDVSNQSPKTKKFIIGTTYLRKLRIYYGTNQYPKIKKYTMGTFNLLKIKESTMRPFGFLKIKESTMRVSCIMAFS